MSTASDDGSEAGGPISGGLVGPQPEEILVQPGLGPVVYQTTTQWSGPVPSPQDLKEYAALDAALPDRILKLLEDEATHRRQREDKALETEAIDIFAERTERRRGQMLAGIMGLSSIIAGVGVAIAVSPAAGAVIAIATPVGLCIALVANRDNIQVDARVSTPNHTTATPPPSSSA